MTEFETRSAAWLDYAEARRRVLAAAESLPPDTVSLDEARGRALAESVRSPVTLPPWDNAAMDGYAVRAADIEGASETHPVRLRVVGEVQAGRGLPSALGAGEALRIMTGAPTPAGCDSVVRVEDTIPGREEVAIRSTRDVGRNIRPRGADLRQGDVALDRGASLDAGAIALLASIGAAHVRVGARPRVAIVTSGDELVPVHEIERVAAGEGIVDSNAPMLAAQVLDCGAAVQGRLHARDDRASVRASLEEAGTAADVVVTVGGASMGTGDLFKRVLDDMGFELDFWRVRIRPGSPFSFGHLPVAGRRIPLLGLPGNPVSAFVTFHLFVRPFLRAQGGHAALEDARIRGTAGEPLVAAEGLTVFLRVRLDGSRTEPVATLTGSQSSGLVSGLPHADGLAVHPEGVGRIAAGETVDVLPLRAHWR